MIVPKNKPESYEPYNVDLVYTVDDMEYLKNGEIHRHSAAKSIMVQSESDLSNLVGYEPGSIAFTAGFAKIWQLDASNNWVQIV